MSLFSESVRGIDGELHSSSAEIIGCLIDHVAQCDTVDHTRLQILEGVVVSIIHETTAEGFSPLAKVVQNFNRALSNQSLAGEVAVGIRLLLISIGTRKGSRISDWIGILETLVHAVKIATESTSSVSSTLRDVMTTTAMAFQYSPLDALLPFNDSLTNLVSSGPLAAHFLSFCLLADQIGRDRFQSLILPRLQQFIAREWNQNQRGLCLLVRQLSATGMRFLWPASQVF
jgi:U3 small nucleolar RNA-associated protein 20